MATSTFKDKIRGAFDLVFLFGNGIEKFSGEKKAALQSLIIPVAFLPVALWFASVYPPISMKEGFSQSQVLGTVLMHSVLSFLFTTLVVAAVAGFMKKTDKFWLFFEASNWASLIFSLITLPFVIMAVTMPDMRDQMDRLFVVVGCYGYFITGCIIYRAFKLNWQLAGALAILTLAVNQELWKLLYWMQGIESAW